MQPITRHEVQNAVADHLRGTGSSLFVERLTDYVLAHDELVLLDRPSTADDQAGWEQQWTTRRVLQIEDDLRSMFEPAPTAAFALDSLAVETALADLAARSAPTRPTPSGGSAPRASRSRRSSVERGPARRSR